jgi:hypothetical protein
MKKSTIKLIVAILVWVMLFWALCLLFSCSIGHVRDLEYHIDHYWVMEKGKYKYVYFIYNGNHAMYLHSNKLYTVDKPIRINQN